MAASMMRTCRSWTSMMTWGSGVGPADADVIELSGVAEGDDAVGVGDVGADAVVGAGGMAAGGGFGPGGVGEGGGGLLWQRPVGALVVVVAGEGVELGLELGEVGGLGCLGAEPFFEGLLEAFDLALGLRVAGLAVFLLDVQAAQFVLEAVAAAAAAGEPGGEHHAVAGQRGGRDAVLGDRGAERLDHDRAGDRQVAGHPQGVPGVVIQPGQDLGVGAVGQRVVGEVGLPQLVRLLGDDPQVGRLRPLARLGDN